METNEGKDVRFRFTAEEALLAEYVKDAIKERECKVSFTPRRAAVLGMMVLRVALMRKGESFLNDAEWPNGFGGEAIERPVEEIEAEIKALVDSMVNSPAQ